MPFDTTHWSVVVAAGSEDSAAARSALATLCETYWYPLYAFVRRRGASPEEACDLTQGFLTSLLERRDFEHLRQERGRFRGFLLASLKHYLANDAAKQHAEKRGGYAIVVPLAFDGAEGRYTHEPAGNVTPESLYERRWALTVIDRVLAQLRAKWTDSGRAREFAELKACLLGEGPPGGYAAVAARLESTEGAVKTAAHRLRRQFQEQLRRDIAATVADPSDVDHEIRYLLRALDG